MTIAEDGEGRRFRLVPWDCPTCGKADKRVVGLRGGDHHRHGLGVASRIVRCRSCTLMFADPFPVPDEASDIYGDPERYFETHDPHHRLEGQRYLVREILRRSTADRPRILDIGSGRGELLRAAIDAGLEQPVGLELSSAMVAHARDVHHVTVTAETVEEHAARLDQPTYDAFVLSAVLEHVHNPDTTLAAVSRLARPGALLYVDVPLEPHLLSHLANALHRIRGSRTVHNLSPTFTPFHVYGFSRLALEKLLGKHGFGIEQRIVWAAPKVPSGETLKDKLASMVATQVNRVANWTGTASNQCVWARFEGCAERAGTP